MNFFQEEKSTIRNFGISLFLKWSMNSCYPCILENCTLQIFSLLNFPHFLSLKSMKNLRARRGCTKLRNAYPTLQF